MISIEVEILMLLCNHIVAGEECQLLRALAVIAPNVPPKHVRRALKRLEAKQMVCSRSIACPKPDVSSPLDTYDPSEPIERARCKELIAKSRERWRQAETKLREVYFALPTAWKIFGHSGAHKGFIPHSALAHDLALSEVFIGLLDEHKSNQHRWVLDPGSATREHGVKQPDALIRGTPDCYAEMVGQGYDATRVGLLFRHAQTNQLRMRIY